MRNTLCTIAALALTLTLMSLDAYGQGLPRGRDRGTRGDARADDDHSPSMSRASSPSWSPRQPPGGISPSRQPAGTPSALRPGIGTVPSGTRRHDGGRISDFLQLPGHGGKIAAPPPPSRKPTVTVRTPGGHTPPVTIRTPGGHTTGGPRPPVYRTVQPARPAGYRPPTYRTQWGRTAPFTSSWYKTPPALPQHYRPPVYHPWYRQNPRYKPSHWWTWATTNTLTTWMHRRWSRPAYYVYGTSGNVYYSDGVVYIDGTRYASADDYYRQALALALAAPRFDDALAEAVEWLPLGVFAYLPTGVSQSSSYFQLAVTKDGAIGGTYVSEATNTTRPIEGTVDKDTQRAAWTFADGKNTDIVFETSIYNLTEDQAPLLVHFGAVQTQEGTLVRMEAPQDG